jgi:NTE family protein
MITRPPKAFESNNRMVVIEPVMEVETFDFDLSEKAINAGKLATERMMARIKSQLLEQGWRPSATSETLSEKRNEFLDKLPPFQIGEITVGGLKRSQKPYAESLILGRVKTARTEAVERNLFLLVSDQHIGDVHPLALFNDSTGLFDVKVDVKEERDLALEAGGNLSSRPVSVGFASVRYSRFGRVPMTLKFSSSFGSLYSTASLFGRFDFHGTLPWAIQPYYLIHRWNYDRSFSTFFQDVRPSFLVSNEAEFGLRWLIPTGNRSVLEFHQCRMQTADFTYPDFDFNPADTSDVERFSGWVFGLDWSRNSLDSKQFARRGNKRLLQIKRFQGTNDAVFENSDVFFARTDSSSINVSFYRIGAELEHYFVSNTRGLSLGFKGSLRLSDEGVRSTYRSTLIHATPMEPMPGSKSLFLEKFRSFNFLSLGGVFDLSILGSPFRWRVEYHRMTSYSQIADTAKGPKLRENKRNRFMAGTWLVCDSQVGLFSLGAEYYQDELDPLLIEFSWGYRLFQNSMRR